MTDDDKLVAALVSDYKTAPIGEADRAMLAYVEKLTRTPAAMSAEDVDTLRRNGFSDTAVVDICQVASYYAFVNRIVDGLGVELEPDGAA